MARKPLTPTLWDRITSPRLSAVEDVVRTRALLADHPSTADIAPLLDGEVNRRVRSLTRGYERRRRAEPLLMIGLSSVIFVSGVLYAIFELPKMLH